MPERLLPRGVHARHVIGAFSWEGLASSWEVLALAGRECVEQGQGQWRGPQFPTSPPALRHLCPWLGAAAGLAGFPPGPAGQLVLQGAQVPPADRPGPGPRGLPGAGLLPRPLGTGRPAPGAVVLERVGPGRCSWRPVKRAHGDFPSAQRGGQRLRGGRLGRWMQITGVR